MESATFKQPIFVRDDSFVLKKIGCVMDAIEFLEEWPVERRGLLHGAACDTCYSAYDGRKSVEAAHKAFATWARRVGVIEDVPLAPSWMTGPKIGSAHELTVKTLCGGNHAAAANNLPRAHEEERLG